MALFIPILLEINACVAFGRPNPFLHRGTKHSALDGMTGVRMLGYLILPSIVIRPSYKNVTEKKNFLIYLKM
jgi:hypothetical protein